MQTSRWLRSAVLIAVTCGIYGLVWAGEPKSPESPGVEKAEKATQAGKKAAKPKLEWVEYGQALERAESEDKHVLIDFYTSWCGWCKVMDKKTYTDARVIEVLNESFLPVKINAESAKKFKVGEREMSGRELAQQFRVRSFPMTFFLKPDGRPIDVSFRPGWMQGQLPGYQKPDIFLQALDYVQARSYAKVEE